MSIRVISRQSTRILARCARSQLVVPATLQSAGLLARAYSCYNGSTSFALSGYMPRHAPLRTRASLIGRRSYSVVDDESAAPVIDFAKIKELSEAHDPSVVIVDVREPDEYKAGHIPGAINIPCKSSPGAYGLNPEEFQLTFGFDKPSTDKTLVFYCLGGIRSSLSEELAGTCDYTKRMNYKGSWEDWVANEGAVEVPEEPKETEETKEETKEEPKK